MSILLKLIFRNIKSSKWQLTAAIVVIFVGIFFYNALTLSITTLRETRDVFYESYNFADFTIKYNDIMSQTVNNFSKVKGVELVTPRITKDVGMHIPNSDKRITARLISIQDSSNNKIVNNIHVIDGVHLNKTHNSVMVDKKFANYHNIKPGDQVTLLINGQQTKLSVSGLFISPEFVYSMRTVQDLTPPTDSFGVILVPESLMRDLFGYENYNEVLFKWDSKHFVSEKEIINNIKSYIKNEESILEIKQKDHLSNMILQNNIDQLSTLAKLFPTLFLLVASLIIYMIQLRLVESYRSQIGLLLSLGYSIRAVFWGYTSISMIVGLIGGLLGTIVGQGLGTVLSDFYVQYFTMPQLDVNTGFTTFLFAMIISIVVSGGAGMVGVFSITRITPNDAFRSSTPRTNTSRFINKIIPFWSKLPIDWRFSIRNLLRNPRRTQFTLIGSMFSGALIIVSLFFPNGMNLMINNHFYEKQLQDYSISFEHILSSNQIESLNEINEITHIDPVLEWSFEIRYQHHKAELLFMGLPKTVELYNIKDENDNKILPPQEGILIPLKYKEKWGIEVGDEVFLYNKQNAMSRDKVRVLGFANDFVGETVYTDIKTLSFLSGVDRSTNDMYANKALITIKSGTDKTLIKKLHQMPEIINIENRKKQADTFDKTYMGATNAFVILLIVFSIAMGFIVVFNTTSINLLERMNEIGTMKLIGYSVKKINIGIKRESILLCIISMNFGIPLGVGLSYFMSKQFGTKILNIPFLVFPNTLVASVIGVLLYTIISQIFNKKFISKVNISELLRKRML